MATDKGPVTLNDVLVYLDAVPRTMSDASLYFKAEGFEGVSRQQVKDLIADGLSKDLLKENIPNEDAEEVQPRTYETTDAGRKMLEPVVEFDGAEPLPTLGQDIDKLLDLNPPPPAKENNPQPPVPVKQESASERKAREHHLQRIRKAEANMYFPPSWRHKPPGAKKDRDDEVLLEEMALEALKQTAWDAERIVRGCLEVAKGLLDKQHEEHVLETARLRVELVEAQGATALSGAHELSVATQEIDRLTQDLELEKKKVKDNESALAGFKSESERKSQQIMVMQEEIEESMKRLEGSATMIADLEAILKTVVLPTSSALSPPALPPLPEKTPEAAAKAEGGAEVPPVIRAELPVAASQKNNDWIGWILVSAVAIACAVGGWVVLNS